MAKRKKLQDLELPLCTNLEDTKSIAEVTKNAYLDFGYYINTHRHLAGLDGVKTSYRRLIYTSMHFPKDKLSHSNTLINFMGNFHPHGLSSVNDMAAILVKSGVFTGEGSFGYTGIDGVVNPPANERYTSIRLSDLYWDLMGDLIKEVPYEVSPASDMKEPTYLPLPLPLSLFMKSLSSGLGVGISMIYPNFSAKSMYEALMANDPNLLEPNVDLILDKSNSELQKLWESGKGRIVYVYKISRQKSSDGKSEGILFETKDGTEIFTPKLNAFKKLEEEGKVFIEDLTDIDGAKLFIGRVPGSRGISVDDIESLCRKICFNATNFSLNVTNGQTCFRIPLKEWLRYTYENYIKLVTEVNKKRIEKCKFDILVQESIPLVSDYIINRNPKADDEEISMALNLPREVLKVVLDKPISYLRKNKDTSDRVKLLKAKLSEYKKFDPVVYTREVISKL